MASYGVAIENRFALLDEEGGKKAAVHEAPKPAEPKPLEKPRTDAKLNKRGAGTGVHNAPSFAPRGRGRMYDRHSGTGRGREVQKDGAGAHNWGSDKTPVDEPASDKWQEQEQEAAPAVVPAEGVEAPAEEKKEGAEEEGEKTVSFEEYMKKKAAAACELDAQLKPRQAEEEDLKGLSEFTPAEDQDIIGAVVAEEGEVVHKEKKAKKQILDVPMFFAQPGGERRGRGRGRGGFRGGERGRGFGGERGAHFGGERGGRGRGAPRGNGEYRGRGRGGRGRGGFRGGRGESKPVDVQDINMFPELHA